MDSSKHALSTGAGISILADRIANSNIMVRLPARAFSVAAKHSFAPYPKEKINPILKTQTAGTYP